MSTKTTKMAFYGIPFMIKEREQYSLLVFFLLYLELALLF